MKDKKVVHFGFYFRHLREERGLSRTEMGKRVRLADAELGNSEPKGLSEKRLLEIERMPKPAGVYRRSALAMAKAMGVGSDAWKDTPVEPYPEFVRQWRVNLSAELRPVVEGVAAEQDIDAIAWIERLIRGNLPDKHLAGVKVVKKRGGTKSSRTTASIPAEGAGAESKNRSAQSESARLR